jgi:hypothetical protein
MLCCYAVFHYAECHILFIIVLSVVEPHLEPSLTLTGKAWAWLSGA